ncbi:MAG: response regulator [Candidatus Thermoplasmatota archaeon]|nr:response regulator [Candidatus Thermoplasmatota archaeon]
MARIMVVEDEEELLSLYSEMMELFGHEIVAAATNGEEAIRAYDAMTEKPDLIILDHRMPVRNGLETAVEILKRDPHEKIVFVSADSTVKKAALEAGVIDFLEKPFVLQRLRDCMQAILGE